MNDLESLGKVIAEQTQKIRLGEITAWEKVLRLHLKPRPSWCPERLWVKLVGLVLIQSSQEL